MSHIGFKIRVGVVSALVGMGLLAAAQAADSRLDDANAHLVKARALVEASRLSNTSQDYQRHINRAEDLIGQAMHEIDLAKNAGNSMPTIKVPLTGKVAPKTPSGLIELNPQPEPPAPK